MTAVIFTVILVFLALLGLGALIDGAIGWFARSTSTQGCMLVVELPSDPEFAESKLLYAIDLARRHDLGLRIVCEEGSETAKIAKKLCDDCQISTVEPTAGQGRIDTVGSI